MLAKTKFPMGRLTIEPFTSVDEAIRGALKIALAEIAERGMGSDSEYRSHWVYGVHRLV